MAQEQEGKQVEEALLLPTASTGPGRPNKHALANLRGALEQGGAKGSSTSSAALSAVLSLDSGFARRQHTADRHTTMNTFSSQQHSQEQLLRFDSSDPNHSLGLRSRSGFRIRSVTTSQSSSSCRPLPPPPAPKRRPDPSPPPQDSSSCPSLLLHESPPLDSDGSFFEHAPREDGGRATGSEVLYSPAHPQVVRLNTVPYLLQKLLGSGASANVFRVELLIPRGTAVRLLDSETAGEEPRVCPRPEVDEQGRLVLDLVPPPGRRRGPPKPQNDALHDALHDAEVDDALHDAEVDEAAVRKTSGLAEEEEPWTEQDVDDSVLITSGLSYALKVVDLPANAPDKAMELRAVHAYEISLLGMLGGVSSGIVEIFDSEVRFLCWAPSRASWRYSTRRES